ncbi:MAG: ketopantoate reductase family protein [Clostridia bacterium]|nr:ketopantoate reductase family protein [Clostridia bacterium]
MDIKTVGIIGFGALGVQFAYRLERGGADVLVIADEARAARYRRDGVLCNGETYIPHVCTPAQAREVDLLIFATKADGLCGAIETVEDFVGKHTLMLSVLNGVTSEEQIAARFGADNVLYATAQGTDAVKEDRVLVYQSGASITLGEHTEGEVSPRAKAVAQFLTEHGVNALAVGDMLRRQWGKLMLNVGLNQACMVFECDYEGIQREGEARDVMQAAMREAQKIAALEGHMITDEEFDAWVRMADGFSPDGKPSMRQDGEAKRRSEVELFSGTMVRLGKKHGVSVPVNEWLYARVQEMEAAY